MDSFNREVELIENEAKAFINNSFRTLRSAEGAFEMLMKFQHIRSRKAINELMMLKFNDILDQYQKEVGSMERIFRDAENEPPRYHFQSPVAGAVAWERHLFHCIKRPIIKFLTMDEMMQSDEGKRIRAEYLQVAKGMKAYEDQQFELWRQKVEDQLPGLLKRNLLTKTQPLHEQPPGSSGDTVITGQATPSAAAMGGGLGGEDESKPEPAVLNETIYWVDFDPMLREFIQESKNLELLGFVVPELSRNVALQVRAFVLRKQCDLKPNT